MSFKKCYLVLSIFCLLSVFCRRLYNFALYGVLCRRRVFVRPFVVSSLCGASVRLLCGCGRFGFRSGFICGPLAAFGSRPAFLAPFGCFARFLCPFSGFTRSAVRRDPFGPLPAVVALPGAVCGPLWVFILFRGFFFTCGGFRRFVAVLAAVPPLGVVSLSEFGRLLGVVVVWYLQRLPWRRFGYNLPVVFSGSFSDPLRLLLLSLSCNTRRRLSLPVVVLRVGCGFNMSLLLARVRLICRNMRRGWACIR